MNRAFPKLTDEWDARFLRLAEHLASWSKDPSTQVGAVIVTPERRIVSTGYNGFPQGVRDDADRYADRETKYALIVHGEINAILFAERPVKGCVLYTWPFAPCVRCAGIVIQAGISRVVAPRLPEDKADRWSADMDLAARMLMEAGVILELI